MTSQVTTSILHPISSLNFNLEESRPLLSFSALFRPISPDPKELTEQTQRIFRNIFKSPSTNQLIDGPYPIARAISRTLSGDQINSLHYLIVRAVPIKQPPAAPIFEPYAHAYGPAILDIISRVFGLPHF